MTRSKCLVESDFADFELEIRLFETRLGWMGVVVGPAGLRQIVFDCDSSADAQKRVDAACATWKDDETYRLPEISKSFFPTPAALGRCADLLQRQLISYADGNRPSWDQVPIDHSNSTAFQRRVIDTCRTVAYGSTIAYGQLAIRSGSPRAARAVGSVMANNRMPLLVPCHRVVGSNGALHGFSSRGGLNMKQRLLELESVRQND